MADKKTGKQQMEDVVQLEDEKFSAEMKDLIRKAEADRLEKSKQYLSRKRLYTVSMMALLMGTSSAFVGLFLMGGDIRLALAAVPLCIIIPPLLNQWANQALKDYTTGFKATFMPEIARVMGKLTFHPTGGIGMKFMAPARILPAHTAYQAEDCFRGKYKGIALTVSEARLLGKKKKAEPVFDGVLVMLKTQPDKFKGHTIITSDHNAANNWQKSRWKSLQRVEIANGIKAGDFQVFADNPEEAVQLADQDFMALMHKLSELFDSPPISAAFYAGNRVLLAIPCAENMFEPGDIFMPVASQSHALKCKKEVEQILHIIDVLDVYEPDNTLGTEAPPPEPESEPEQQKKPEES